MAPACLSDTSASAKYIRETLKPVLEQFSRHCLEHFPPDPLKAMAHFSMNSVQVDEWKKDGNRLKNLRQQVDQDEAKKRYMRELLNPILEEFAANCLRSCPPDPLIAMAEFAAQKGSSQPVETDTDAFTAASSQLQDEDPTVRREAVQTISSIARRGDDVVVNAVLGSLDDQHPSVRQSVLRALCNVAHRGDERVIKGVKARLRDEDQNVRQAATEAVPHIAEKGDQKMIVELTARLQLEDSPNVRLASVHTLLNLANKGDERLIKAIIGRLRDDDPNIRKVAIDVLPKAVEKGDERYILELAARLEDENESAEVRQAAAEPFVDHILRECTTLADALGRAPHGYDSST